MHVPVTFLGLFNLGLTLKGTSTMRMESFRNLDPVEFSDAANAATGNINLAC